MKSYPLNIVKCIEFEGYDVMSYYSKGHQNKKEFIESLAGDWEVNAKEKDIYYTYAKVTPSPTGGMLINFKKDQCKGSFPGTVLDV